MLHSFRVTWITDLLTQGVPLDDVYTPHSLRATTATLLLDAGVDIIKVKELFGHGHVTTTRDLRQATTGHERGNLARRAHLTRAVEGLLSIEVQRL